MMSIDELRELTDAEVLAWARMANDDCIEAGETQHGSDWHGTCFAAMVVLSQEMTRRGIRLKPLH